ncbi:MAG: hypothetical protein AAGB04_26105, partial [Pseudomonadota bacterium]
GNLLVRGDRIAAFIDPAVYYYTVMHDRSGPSYGILFGRLEDGTRFIANTPEEGALLQEMTERDYVGARGRVQNLADGRNEFRPE